MDALEGKQSTGFIVLALCAAAVLYYLYNNEADAAVTDSNALSNSGAATFQENDASGNTITYPNTAGYRNHNPGNLEYIAHNPFNGQIGQAGTYGVYDTMENGARAAGKELDKYVANGLTTITEIITQWAPPASNPTAQYIAYVAQQCGVGATDTLNWPQEKVDVCASIFYFENGAMPIPIGDLTTWLGS